MAPKQGKFADLAPELVTAVNRIAHGRQVFSLEDVKEALPSHNVNLNFDKPKAEENLKLALESAENIVYKGVINGQEVYCWTKEAPQGQGDAQGCSRATTEAGAKGMDLQHADPKQSQAEMSQNGQAGKRKRNPEENANKETVLPGSPFTKRTAAVKATAKMTQINDESKISNKAYFGAQKTNGTRAKMSLTKRGNGTAVQESGVHDVTEDLMRCEKQYARGRRCTGVCEQGSSLCKKHVAPSQVSA